MTARRDHDCGRLLQLAQASDRRSFNAAANRSGARGDVVQDDANGVFVVLRSLIDKRDCWVRVRVPTSNVVVPCGLLPQCGVGAPPSSATTLDTPPGTAWARPAHPPRSYQAARITPRLQSGPRFSR